ncbi:hypothetical protein Tco_0453212 [Tanacetum coccineum]
MGLLTTHPDEGIDAEYQSDTETLLLTTVADIQALLVDSDEELKDDSDDVFKAGEEMDEDIQEPETKETQTLKEDPALNKKVLEAAKAYTKNSTNLTNLFTLSVGPRMTRIENTHAHIQFDIASLKQDTFEIKNIMIEIFCAFKGHSFSTPSSSVPTTTLAITEEKNDIVTKEVVEKEPAKEPETKNVEKEHVQEPQVTEPIPTTIVRPLTKRAPKLKMIGSSSRFQLTNTILEEEKLEKAARDARLLEMNKFELIKVVHEEATKVGVDPKIISSAKGGKEFVNIQEAKIKVLNREHSEKIKIARELKKKIIDQYRWTTSSRLKPEIIIDIHIYPNTKPVVITVYIGNDRRNFNVHNPFKFGDFRVTELDELSPIIQKKKNKVVGDLMTSLGKRYDRLKTRIPGLECNRSLPKGIPFVNNLIIEQPENRLFFIDVFGDEAFQRMSDIHKSLIEETCREDANGWLFMVQQFFFIATVNEDKKLSKNVKQDGEVKVYQEQFEVLLNRLELVESYAVSIFIGGLKSEISMSVRMFTPSTLKDSFCLERMQEATLALTKTKPASQFSSQRSNSGSYASRYKSNVNSANSTVVKPLFPSLSSSNDTII